MSLTKRAVESSPEFNDANKELPIQNFSSPTEMKFYLNRIVEVEYQLYSREFGEPIFPVNSVEMMVGKKADMYDIVKTFKKHHLGLLCGYAGAVIAVKDRNHPDLMNQARMVVNKDF